MIPRIPAILAVLFAVIACLWHARVTLWLFGRPVAVVPLMAVIGFWAAFFLAGLTLFAWFSTRTAAAW